MKEITFIFAKKLMKSESECKEAKQCALKNLEIYAFSLSATLD